MIHGLIPDIYSAFSPSLRSARPVATILPVATVTTGAAKPHYAAPVLSPVDMWAQYAPMFWQSTMNAWVSWFVR